MQDDLDIVRTWLHIHDHGWRSVVEERRDGTFIAGVEQRGEHGVTRRWTREYRTVVQAKIATDIDVRQRGGLRLDAQAKVSTECIENRHPVEGGQLLAELDSPFEVASASCFVDVRAVKKRLRERDQREQGPGKCRVSTTVGDHATAHFAFTSAAAFFSWPGADEVNIVEV